MKNYEATLRAVEEYKTLAAHITALGKILSATEDVTLKQHLEATISQLQMFHARAKNKSTPISPSKLKSPAAENLIAYCNRMVGAQEPEWQVIAKRHGWGPK